MAEENPKDGTHRSSTRSPDADPDPEVAAPEKDSAPPQPWHPIHMPCPRCASKPKAQVTPKFNRILVIQCGKCGWKLDIEVLRKALKAEHFVPDGVSEIDALIED